MSDLKKQLIRLGEEQPDLRQHIRPLLDTVLTQKTAKTEEELLDWGHEMFDLDHIEQAIAKDGRQAVLDELEEMHRAVNRSMELIRSSPLRIVEGPDLSQFYDALVLEYDNMHFGLGRSDLTKTSQVKSLIRYLDQINGKVGHYIENVEDPFYSDISRTIKGISKYFKGKHLAFHAFVDSLREEGIRVWS